MTITNIGKHITVSSVAKILAGIVALYTLTRLIYSLAILGHSSWEPWTHSAVFVIIAAVITLCPGIFLWSKLNCETDNPFLPPVFIISTSLGFTMLTAWLLYLFGAFTRPIALVLVAGSAILGLLGLRKTAASVFRIFTQSKISPCELLALAVSLLFCEGMFECVAGTPVSAWDAVVSWDKWASDIAVRNGLGGYISGAYPPGLPLLTGLFYKLILPPGTECITSIVHLHASGFYQIYPLLLALSLIAVARQLKFNAAWAIAVFFGCWFNIHHIMKSVGYTDIPLAASIIAALAVTAGRFENRIQHINVWNIAVAIFALFPVVFVKGNGLAMLIISVITAFIFRIRCNRELVVALLLTFVFAAVFYVHQWITGVWTDLGETSPFNHSLVVVSSHSYLVNPTWAHFTKVAQQMCISYGFGEGFLLAVFAPLATAALIIPLALRRTRAAAVIVIILAAIWFFTGSYDERNLLYVIAIAAVVVPWGTAELFQGHKKTYAVILSVITVSCAYSFSCTRLPQIAIRCFSSYAPPAAIALSPEKRASQVLKLAKGGYEFFMTSPMSDRAHHIIVFNPSYRYLKGKGVYPYQKNAFNHCMPHDIAVASKGNDETRFIPRDPFVPVSNINGCSSFGINLYIANPTIANADYSVDSANGERTISIPVTENVQDCGFVSVTFDGPAENSTVFLSEPSSLAGKIFSSYTRGNTVLVAYWVKKGTTVLKFGIEQDCERPIVKVETGY